MSNYRLLMLIGVTTILLLHTSYAGPASRTLALAAARASKIPRSIRAPFRNTEMMTARGFGKRGQIIKYKENAIPWNLGKRETSFFDDFQTDTEPLEQVLNEQTIESFPIEWLANEMQTNPLLAKSILHRFVDTNKDGLLTAHELLQTGTSSAPSSGYAPSSHSSSSLSSINNLPIDMKVFLLCVTTFLVLNTAKGQTTLCTYEANGALIRDPLSCANFYQCSWGKPVLFNCPDGLLFNNVLKVCDWPKNVDCESTGPGTTAAPPTTSTPPTQPTPPTPPTNSICYNQLHGAYLADPLSCGHFYQCTWGNAVHFECPAGLHFDIKYNVCNWPKDAGCELGSSTSLPPLTNLDCKNVPDGSVLPDVTSCLSYYVCLSGSPSLLRCKPGFFYDYVRQHCSMPEFVSCYPGSQNQPIGVPPSNKPNCANMPNEYISADPTSCKTYYVCLNDQPSLLTCGPGLYYDYVKNICSTPQWVTCYPGSENQPIITEPVEPTDCKNVPDGSVLPDVTSCLSYYVCLSGSPSLLKCKPGFFYDYVRQHCSMPEFVSCYPGSHNQPIGVPPSNKPNCANMPNEYISADPTSCKTYYVCLNDQPSLLTCGPGLYYDYVKNICSTPQWVTCYPGSENQPIITEPVEPTDCTNVPNGYVLPDPTSCRTYFICLNGEKSLLTCATGYYYDYVRNLCSTSQFLQCYPGSGNTPTDGGIAELDERCIGSDEMNPTLLPHDTDCTKFFKCSFGYAWEMDCVEGQHWNLETTRCEDPSTANCIRPL